MIFVLYFAGILNVLLGIFVMINSPKKKENILFALMTIFIFFWTVFNAIFQETTTQIILVISTILAYNSASLLLYTVNLLISSFNNKYKFNLKNLSLDILILNFSILICYIEGFVFTEVDIKTRVINTSIGFYILLGIYIYFFIKALINIFRNLSIIKSNRAELIKQRLIYIGIGGALTAGIFTNLILPAFEVYSAVSLGPTFTLLMLSLTSFAILRYRAFNSRFLLGNIFYYLVLGFLPFISFFLFGNLYIFLFGSLTNLASIIMSVFISILFVITFNQLNNYLKKQVTTRFINPGYDPYEVVDSLGKQLATKLDISEIAESMNKSLKRTVRASFEALVICEKEIEKADNNIPRIKKIDLFGEEYSNKYVTDDLYERLNQLWHTAGPIIISMDEIKLKANPKLNDLENWLKPIIKIMELNDIRVITPIYSREEVYGAIVIGSKEADSPFTIQDLELIESIASATALSVARSFLYQEVSDLNQNLQMRVYKATENLQKQNKDLETAIDRLEKLRQQERDMLDVMGHELRTPITIVRNALSVLKMKAEKGNIAQEKLDDYIDKALESTKREITLIETLLAATKVDANRIQLNLEKVDMIDVINDSIDGQIQNATERGLKIIFEKPENMDVDFWSSYADRVRIQEIQDNFLSNAVKYTSKGTVTIKMAKAENKDGSLVVKVSIIDTGIGIPKDDLRKLGRKFFRAKQYISEDDNKEGENRAVVRPGGTGLGLYVTFELVQLMGGEIEIDSELGKGSTFSYTIPIYEGQPPKHVDQTFSDDDELNTEEVRKRSSQYLIIDGETVEREKKMELDDEKPKEDRSKSESNGKDYKKINSANDIISKINKSTTDKSLW